MTQAVSRKETDVSFVEIYLHEREGAGGWKTSPLDGASLGFVNSVGRREEAQDACRAHARSDMDVERDRATQA